jgi:hypothetical protein
MDYQLRRIAIALEAISSRGLTRLRGACERAPQFAAGLLAWIEHAAGWELDRRNGHHYRLAEPVEAIAPEEVTPSMLALISIAAAFAGAVGVGAAETGAILELLDATMAMISAPTDGGGMLH